MKYSKQEDQKRKKVWNSLFLPSFRKFIIFIISNKILLVRLLSDPECGDGKNSIQWSRRKQSFEVKLSPITFV